MTVALDPEIVRAYRDMYGMHCDPEETLVLEHWELEKQLRQDLMQAAPEARCSTAERVYSELYEKLKWHDGLSDTVAGSDNFNSWLYSLPDNTHRIYEIGSGQGTLIRQLADLGYSCRGTEITSRRGEVYAHTNEGLSWGGTDGVHVDQYEPNSHYDVVISNQVVEHLHPEDLLTHFESIRKVLRPGGMYLVSTPHHLTGPHDVSRAFRCRQAAGLHLKEYDWRSLSKLARRAGYVSIESATLSRLRALRPNSRLLQRTVRVLHQPYLYAMIGMESALGVTPSYALRTRVAKVLKSMRVFSDNIFLACRTAG